MKRKKPTYIEVVSRNLSYYREKRGWTKTELAEKVGVTLPALLNWENGTSMPQHEKIDLLCDVLNITRPQLLLDDYDLGILDSVNVSKIPIYSEILIQNGEFAFDGLIGYIEIEKYQGGGVIVFVEGGICRIISTFAVPRINSKILAFVDGDYREVIFGKENYDIKIGLILEKWSVYIE